MPVRLAEAFILRTYPFKETDCVVSFFTREFGKRRGVARAARRPKSKFGASLEPLTQVRVQFYEREGSELGTLDHCEILASPLASGAHDLLHSVAVSLLVEVADRMLPDHEVSDATYRLLQAAAAGLHAGGSAWLPLTYYLYWMVRLGGFLPVLDLSPDAQALAVAISRQPLSELAAWAPSAEGPNARELRQRLKSCLEDHLEGPLRSWPMLATLEA